MSDTSHLNLERWVAHSSAVTELRALVEENPKLGTEEYDELMEIRPATVVRTLNKHLNNNK